MSSNLLKPAASGADQIQHSAGKLGGILGGMALGCIAGAALVAAPFVTGIAAAACFAGTVAATGISMGMLAEGLEQVGVLFNTNLVTGNINLFCSDNVLIGLRPAARAGLEDYANCSGLSFIFHVDYPTTFIAEGSSTVFINGLCAARQGDLLQCGASIKDGNDTVLIGGETARVLDVDITNVDRFEHFLVGVTAVSGLVIVAPVMFSSISKFVITSTTLASGIILFPIIDAEFKAYCDENLGEGWYNIISGGMGLVFVCSSVVMSSLRTKMHINKSLNNLFKSTSNTISKFDKNLKKISEIRKTQKNKLRIKTKQKINKLFLEKRKSDIQLLKNKKISNKKQIIDESNKNRKAYLEKIEKVVEKKKKIKEQYKKDLERARKIVPKRNDRTSSVAERTRDIMDETLSSSNNHNRIRRDKESITIGVLQHYDDRITIAFAGNARKVRNIIRKLKETGKIIERDNKLYLKDGDEYYSIAKYEVDTSDFDAVLYINPKNKYKIKPGNYNNCVEGKLGDAAKNDSGKVKSMAILQRNSTIEEDIFIEDPCPSCAKNAFKICACSQ